MKKDAEIKIIEQIEVLISKLIKGDTYFKDDLKHHNFDITDISVMTNNIKNDFPISLNTNFRDKLERALVCYKIRLKRSYNRERILQHNTRASVTIIKDQEVEIKAMLQFREKLLNVILDMVYASSPEEAQHLEHEILASFPIDLIVMQKAQRGYPMTGEELRYLKDSLNMKS